MTKKNSDRAPHLGIFWLVDGKLIFDILPLSKAQPYGDHMTHPRSHIRVWATFERSGRVPRGSEYDEYPRVGKQGCICADSFGVRKDLPLWLLRSMRFLLLYPRNG
jgi:hypothetical protein